MAKADIRASPKGISISPDRCSAREPKWVRRARNRASAERSWRTSPVARAMPSYSLGPSGKTGSSGKDSARGICDMEAENQRRLQKKTSIRELLPQAHRHDGGSCDGAGLGP